MEGTVVRKDEAEALTWYKDAAESGNPTAFSMLGEYYDSKNQFEEALYWSYLAKEMGIFGSEQYYSVLNSNIKLMNKEAISKRAEEWLDYNVKYCDVVTYPSHFEQSENLPAHWIEVQVKQNQNSDVSSSLKTIAVCDHEVTVYEWEKYMRACPSGIHNLYPVEVTNLAEIFKYCNLKSMAENLDPCYVYEQCGSDPNNWPESIDIKLFTNTPNNNGYRLPTENEWISAATGKKVDETFVYSGSNSIDEVAWCASNKANTVTYDTSSGAGIYTEKTKPYKEGLKLHRVCLKKSNSYSLFDMSGNAKEWCLDPSPDFPNSILVLKGGSYLEDKSRCSIEAKEIMSLDHEQTNMKGTGIRLVRTLHH